jgi:quercetin dioxygenase-like cupin family protein
MSPTQPTQVVVNGTHGLRELLGPTIEFLTSPSETGAVYCVMKGTIPPGVSVPLHSHGDFESVFVLSGTLQVLSERGDTFDWLDVAAGGFIHIPSNAKHAFRNRSSEPVVQLVTTTPQLGRFFQEVGRAVTPGVTLPPPTPEEVQHFIRVAGRYQIWIGSPAENAAVGISIHA